MSNSDAPPNSVGWHILEGYPWWPVYICDATKLRPNLHLLGSGHRGILRKAKDFPKDFGLVYFFGSHDFGTVRLKKGLTLKPWDCAEKDKLLKGVPNHLVKKKGQLDDLKVAIQEAEDYLSTPEDIRLPPHMVPSDLDPTLDPPPPIERDELMDEDDDEEDDDAAGDADGGHASDGHGDDDEAMSGGSDHESRKSKEKTKKKSSSKDKKASSSKDKKASSKSSSSSSSKDKDKDKKASSSKSTKESSSSSKDKEKKSSKKDKTAATAGDDKKRKKTLSDEPSTGDTAVKTPLSKVAKKDKTADVKSEGVTAAASSSSSSTMAPSAKSSKSSKSKSADAANQLSGEALSAVLEKEIKWILANCQFEEMTTKTVRKLLEKRLSMDLRHHKASIKEGVARVIASMEDGTDVPVAGEADGDAAVKTEAAAAVSETEAVAPTESKAEDTPAAADTAASGSASPAPAKDEPMKSDAAEPATEHTDEPSQQQPETTTRDDALAQHLSDAERELGLALNEEPKLIAALQALQQNVPSVEKPVLVNASALVTKLVALRAHEEASVASLVAALAKQWDAEDVIPAPKPIREADILEMKEKLENSETSHEDMLACLTELAKMRLQMSHLKNTGIARVVANLRQHANDKVSIAAINLRKSWIQLTKSKTDSKSDVDRVKTLESMNRILEQKSSGEGESSHLAVLEKLQGMTLSTQDIIKSKIGVVVSKLRKSSNEKVAKAATLLRKKWKAEAAA